MNEYIMAAKFSVGLAVLGAIFAILIRLLLAKYRPLAYPMVDSKICATEQPQIGMCAHTAKPAAVQSMQYIIPTFKKNNLDEDMISRSFKINTSAPFDDDSVDHALHAAGLANGIYIE